MASLRAATLAIVGGLFGSVAVGDLVAGCSSGDTTVPGESGGDGSSTDVTTNPEAADDSKANDVTRADATEGGADAVTTDADATVDAGDTGPGADVAVDGGDTGTDGDASTETDADASVDGGVDGGEDAAPDADGGNADDGDAADANGIGLLAYPGQYVAALCSAWATCCGAGFDQTTCESDFRIDGWANTLPHSDVYDAGNLSFDSTQATSCITALQNWPCGAWTASDNQAIISACTNVLGGTIAIGSTSCQDSFECASGAYCDAATCTALAGNGGSCTGDEMCSYVGTKQPALYCNLYPPDGGSVSAGTCAAPQSDGTSSFCGNAAQSSDFACINRLCGDNSTCASSAGNPATNACAVYRGG
jgi:hypothetical protein